ncbi:MAG: hypothetical protein [Podoviridae sp. ctpVR23]|nr:MAG: hypothetical protein [Podoviridae sp. ctpVR23]
MQGPPISDVRRTFTASKSRDGTRRFRGVWVVPCLAAGTRRPPLFGRLSLAARPAVRRCLAGRPPLVAAWSGRRPAALLVGEKETRPRGGLVLQLVALRLQFVAADLRLAARRGLLKGWRQDSRTPTKQPNEETTVNTTKPNQTQLDALAQLKAAFAACEAAGLKVLASGSGDYAVEAGVSDFDSSEGQPVVVLWLADDRGYELEAATYEATNLATGEVREFGYLDQVAELLGISEEEAQWAYSEYGEIETSEWRVV